MINLGKLVMVTLENKCIIFPLLNYSKFSQSQLQPHESEDLSLLLLIWRHRFLSLLYPQFLTVSANEIGFIFRCFYTYNMVASNIVTVEALEYIKNHMFSLFYSDFSEEYTLDLKWKSIDHNIKCLISFKNLFLFAIFFIVIYIWAKLGPLL